MIKIIYFIFIFIFWSMLSKAQSNITRISSEMTKDSTIKYGIDITPYLESVSPQNRISSQINYTPYINKFLKNHKYIKFPAMPITIGLDESDKSQPVHLVLQSGNRLYFPPESKLLCPLNLKTNGYMLMIQGKENVFIYGANIEGAKSNKQYVTSPYGTGLCVFYSSNIIIDHVLINNSTGDGLAIRVGWEKICRNVYINDVTISNATRIGLLITGVQNATFNAITINNTGDSNIKKVLAPQTALSFEPDNCESEYINIVMNGLYTNDNLGPVLGTANFANMNNSNKCGKKRISVIISNWIDNTNDPRCYGATFDMSTAQPKLDLSNISGTFKIINPVFKRGEDLDQNRRSYFFLGNDEKLNGGVHYSVTGWKLKCNGQIYDMKNRNNNMKIKKLTLSTTKIKFD